MKQKYEDFDILEVAKECGIIFHPRERGGEEFKARCPFCDDTKYHLGINRRMDRFHCFKCKEKGNSVSLYAKICGISNKEAFLHLKNNDGYKNRVIYLPKEEKILPIKPLSERHNVYYDLLRLLRLNKAHLDNLNERGLSFDQVNRFMYRSLPHDKTFRTEVVEKLASHYDLNGIPGFFKDRYGNWQMYYNAYGGIMIPFCNREGYIQGLQIRLDIPDDSKESRFRWFSSKHFSGGTAASAWVHVVGDVNAKEAILTEGAMKADISSVLSNGKLFLAVPGANAIYRLPELISEMGITKIYEAMDMDKRSKPEVKKALIALRKTLDQMNIVYDGCWWNPDYNGMDNYLLAKRKHSYMPLAA